MLKHLWLKYDKLVSIVLAELQEHIEMKKLQSFFDIILKLNYDFIYFFEVKK